jgi:hypothetical protein
MRHGMIDWLMHRSSACRKRHATRGYKDSSWIFKTLLRAHALRGLALKEISYRKLRPVGKNPNYYFTPQ